MDEHTPIDVPIRLEEWDRHDRINEVDTIVVDVRPILDATDYGRLPAPDEWDADFIAEEAQRLGLLRLWDGPFTVELPDAERRTGAKRPGARVRGALTMEALAKTPEDALALADRAGRAAVRMVEKGLAPNLVVGRLVYRERHWMEEGL